MVWSGPAIALPWPGRAFARAAPAQRGRPVLDGYRIERLLARGRSAAVYFARDRLGRPAALKVRRHSPDCGASAGTIFADEWSLLARIRDDRVVRVHGHGLCAGLAYLALEYVPGGTLRRRLRPGLSAAEAVRLLREAARAVAAVHAAGVVHRDLKPENFLVRPDGTLVLADFGLAARAGDPTARAQAGCLVGTPAYVAPEQLRGDVPTASADVYGLGVLFHEMLSSKPPFAGSTALEVVAQHLVAAVPRLAGGLARFQPLIDRLLDKRPQHRPSDAAAVLQAIEALAPSDTGGAC